MPLSPVDYRHLFHRIPRSSSYIHSRVESTDISRRISLSTSYQNDANSPNSLSKLAELRSVPVSFAITERAVDSNHILHQIYHRSELRTVAFHAVTFLFLLSLLPPRQSRDASRSTAARRRGLSITACQRTRHEHGDFKHC